MDEQINSASEPATITPIDSGERRLDVAEMKRFAEIYKQSISYFFK